MKRLAILFIILAVVGPLAAHEGYGLTFDGKGNLYFPDNQNRVIWKLPPDGPPEALLTERVTHNLVFDSEGNLYFDHEEQDYGQWFTSLWKRTPEGTVVEIIPRTVNRRLFDGSVWTLDGEGTVHFFFERKPNMNVLLKRATPTTYMEIAGSGFGHADGVGRDASFTGAQAMIHGDDDRFYVTDGDSLRAVNQEGIVTTVARALTIANAPEMPKKEGEPRIINGLYGLARDGEVFYVAYYGNRVLYRIEDGKAKTFYRSEWPWSPIGVTVRDGVVYVLESGATDGNDAYAGPRVSRLDTNGKNEIMVTIGE